MYFDSALLSVLKFMINISMKCFQIDLASDFLAGEFNFPSRKSMYNRIKPEYLCGCAQHTHTLCGCAHSVRRGCGRLLHKECAVSVRAEKYQVCIVRKFVQIKKLKIYIYLKQKPPRCVLWCFIQTLRPI